MVSNGKNKTKPRVSFWSQILQYQLRSAELDLKDAGVRCALGSSLKHVQNSLNAKALSYAQSHPSFSVCPLSAIICVFTHACISDRLNSHSHVNMYIAVIVPPIHTDVV